MNPTSIWEVLIEFRDVRDSGNIFHGTAVWLVFYFTKMSTPFSLKAHLQPKKSIATVLYGERIFLYSEADNYSLLTYATDDTIARGIENIVVLLAEPRSICRVIREEAVDRCILILNTLR